MKVEEDDPAKFLEISSFRIVKIAIPVIVTLLCDAILTRFLEGSTGSVNTLDRSFSETLNYSNAGLPTLWSVWIALILVGFIIIATAIILALYFCGCVKVLMGWMVLAVTLLLSYYVYMTLGKVPEILNVPMDYLSLVLVMLNLVVVGNLAIFWRAPQIVTQVFLVLISILVAMVFLTLPDWTIWILLVLLVIYDACVVLCPHGLLNMLIKKSEERGDEIPALVYASAAWNCAEDGSGSGSGSGSSSQREDDWEQAPAPDDGEEEVQAPASRQRRRRRRKKREAQPPPEEHHEEEEEKKENQDADPENPDDKKEKKQKPKKEREGVRLGLGDFCFYGVLVTRAARLGWDITILCVFAVVLGLALTLICLAVFKRPLPALPFSLILGIIFFLTGAFTFRRFDLVIRQRQFLF